MHRAPCGEIRRRARVAGLHSRRVPRWYRMLLAQSGSTDSTSLVREAVPGSAARWTRRRALEIGQIGVDTSFIAPSGRQRKTDMGINQRADIAMGDDEIAAFLRSSRNCTLATLGPNGAPHLVAMWYALIDGQLWFETKAKSQKARNLQRDGRATVLVEDGATYDTLRGVALEGHAVIIDDPDPLWQVGVSVWERYTGPYSDEMQPFVALMLHKRVAVRFDVERTRSWDHRKLHMDPMPIGGSTATGG